MVSATKKNEQRHKRKFINIFFFLSGLGCDSDTFSTVTRQKFAVQLHCTYVPSCASVLPRYRKLPLIFIPPRSPKSFENFRTVALIICRLALRHFVLAGLYWYCLMSLRFLTTNYYWAWLTVQVILDAAQRWNCWLFTILTNFFTGIYVLLFRNTYCASWLFKAK